MDKHLSSILHLTFPKLYHRNLSFNVGNGWFGLLCGLSIQIQSEFDRFDLNEKITFEITEVKVKSAGLRIYFDASGNEDLNTNIYNLIVAAEEKSFHICESCGKSAYTRKINGWPQTLCNICSIYVTFAQSRIKNEKYNLLRASCNL